MADNNGQQAHVAEVKGSMDRMDLPSNPVNQAQPLDRTWSRSMPLEGRRGGAGRGTPNRQGPGGQAKQGRDGLSNPRDQARPFERTWSRSMPREYRRGGEGIHRVPLRCGRAHRRVGATPAGRRTTKWPREAASTEEPFKGAPGKEGGGSRGFRHRQRRDGKRQDEAVAERELRLPLQSRRQTNATNATTASLGRRLVRYN